MEKWVALLRGVNVGGKNKVPMEQLRAACSGAGLHDVQSYIASGNLICRAGGDADDVAEILHHVLTGQFGVTTPVQVLPAVAMRQILANCPFPESEGNAAHGYFCFTAPELDQSRYESLRTSSEEVQIVDNVIWLRAPDGVGRSKLVASFDKIAPGTIMTGRNLNTIRRLVEMLDE